MQTAYQQESVPEPVRELSRVGSQMYLGYKHSAHMQRAIDLGEEADESLPERFRRFVDFFDRVSPPAYANALQQPTYQYYPELEAKPRWDSAAFSVVAALEAAFPVIREEFEAAVKQQDNLQPYVGDLPTQAPDDWQLLSGNPT